MDEANRPRARAVFLNVANLPPQAQSEALRSACAGDDALLAQVQAMLDNEKQTMAMMADPASDRLIDPNATHTMNGGNTPTADLAPRMQPGQQIGRYKLLDQIGEGGFGAVWAAEQREPVKRRVALKIIKLGMDTRQVIARFEAERQALAMMDHPNIAKVFDAGTTETGRP